MIVTTLQENLAAGLGLVAKGVGRGSLPVMGNVLVEASAEFIKLTTNNFDMSITTVIGAKVEEAGSTTIPHKIWSEVVGQLPPERIDLKLDTETQRVTMKCGRINTTLNCIEAAEFPVFQSLPGAEAHLEFDTLQAIAKQVAVAAAADMARPVFTGVYLSLTDARLRAVAADGFRMADLVTNGSGVRMAAAELDKLATTGVDDAGNRIAWAIVPAPVIVEVARISAKDDEEPIVVRITDKNVIFSIGPTTVVANTINGEFPDVDRVIPDKFPMSITFDSGSILAAIKLAHMFAKTAANVVRFAVTPPEDGEYAEVIVSARSAELGDGTTPVGAIVKGVVEPFQFALSSAYMIDALKAIQSPQIRMQLNSPSSAVVITPVGVDGYRHAIMPMHVT